MTDHAASTRRFTFSAGHRYWVERWSPEENERFFGRLTVPHGHNYTLDVTVRGPIDPQTGMVIDLDDPPEARALSEIRALSWVKLAMGLDKVSA